MRTLSLANNVTQNDFDSVNSYSTDVKIKVLTLYLIGDAKRAYNTAEVADLLFGNTDGRAISAILRVYNIGEKTHRSNSGIYRANKIDGYNVTADNIASFVRSYPSGCFPNDDFDSWMRRLIAKHKENLRLQEQQRKERELELKRQEEERKRQEEARKKKLEDDYNKALASIITNPENSFNILKSLGDYKDAKQNLIVAAYNFALKLKDSNYLDAIYFFDIAKGYMDSDKLIIEAKYNAANELIHYNPERAINLLYDINPYKDSEKLISKCQTLITEIQIQREREERERKKKIAITILSVLAAIAVVVVIIIFLINKSKNDARIKHENELNERYTKAVSLMENGRYDSAYEIFTDEEIKEFIPEAAEKAKESRYLKGNALVNDKKYEDAMAVYKSLGEYKDSKDLYRFAAHGVIDHYIDKNWFKGKKSDVKAINIVVSDQSFGDSSWEIDVDIVKGYLNTAAGIVTIAVSPGYNLNVKNAESLFNGYSNVQFINGLSVLNTSEVESMKLMFAGLNSVQALDLTGLNTSMVTNMSGMFKNCKKLTALNITNLNVGKVENFAEMFSGCTSLVSIDLSNFNTYSAFDLRGMFSNCRSLTSIDISKFDVSGVQGTTKMFYGCENLRTIYISKYMEFNKKMQESKDMFTGCKNLVGGDGTRYSDKKSNDVKLAKVGKLLSEGYLTYK